MKYQHVLHIDDDIEDQEIFDSALHDVSSNIQCTSLTSAKLALNKLNDNEIKPDVIFLDLNMPIMSGHEFLRAIKSIEHLKAIPVIVFSTSSNASTIADSKLLGAIDFITKPNRFNDLVDALKQLIV